MRLSKLTLFFGVLAIVAGISACNQKQSNKTQTAGVEYYRNLIFSETPFDIEKVALKLTADQAAGINSYKFMFDNTGRLVSVEFVRGEELLGYSSMGDAAKITYDYADNKQIKHFFDENWPGYRGRRGLY